MTFKSMMILALICFYPAAVLPQPLKNLPSSKPLRRLEHECEAAGLYKKNYFKNDPSLYKLFGRSDGPKYLHFWLGTKGDSFEIIAQQQRRDGEIAFAGSNYQNRRGTIVKVSIYVPHPRLRAKAETGLSGQWLSLGPEAAVVEYSEGHQIQKKSATLYRLNTKDCVLMMQLAKYSVLRLDAACSDRKVLLELASLLSLQRFENSIQP